MPKLTTTKALNATFSPSYIPVAVFVGGTSGIGEAMVKVISSYTKGMVHIIIVSRNRAATKKTFTSLRHPIAANGEPVLREFMTCDAYLMRNIDATCRELTSKLSKINFLVLSAGYLRMTGRDETEEGLDKMLVMRYYNRFKFTKELLPLLHNAKALGEDAGMLSIMVTGQKDIQIDATDLDMKKNYGAIRAAMHTCAYNDIMIEVGPSLPIFVDIALTISFAEILPRESWDWVYTYLPGLG